MKTNLYNIHFKDVPNGWAICFNDNCAQHEDCLRRIAGELAESEAPKENLKALCVTPLAYRDGSCKLYAALKKERMAWGFSHLYDQVLKIHYADIKDDITHSLRGRSNYYRYNNGERKLSEEQQQKIANIFRRYGYEREPEFDHYEEHLVFPF